MEVLAESQVALGGLDRGVAERELDLLERGAALVGELGEGAPQVVRRDFTEAGLAGIGGYGLEDRLGPERSGSDAAGLVEGPQHGSGGDGGGGGPAAFALGDRFEAERGELAAPQAAPQQNAVAQAFPRCRVGGGEQLLGLRRTIIECTAHDTRAATLKRRCGCKKRII